MAEPLPGSERVFLILCLLGLVLDDKSKGTCLAQSLRQGGKPVEGLLFT